jgi:hypothetical protein
LTSGHTGALNFKYLKNIFEDSKNSEKIYLYIDNDVYFQVCIVSVQNVVYSTLHKKRQNYRSKCVNSAH